jgi:hypothetical protein
MYFGFVIHFYYYGVGGLKGIMFWFAQFGEFRCLADVTNSFDLFPHIKLCV